MTETITNFTNFLLVWTLLWSVWTFHDYNLVIYRRLNFDCKRLLRYSSPPSVETVPRMSHSPIFADNLISSFFSETAASSHCKLGYELRFKLVPRPLCSSALARAPKFPCHDHLMLSCFVVGLLASGVHFGVAITLGQSPAPQRPHASHKFPTLK